MQISRRTIPKAALIGGLIGAVINVVIWLIGTTIWGPIEVPPPSPDMPINANGLTEVMIIMPAFATLVGAVGAGIAMFGISYLKGNQYLIFQIVSFIALALSFITVINVPDSTDMNILGLMHITAAMPIVGALTIMTPEQPAQEKV
ncbi:MAG: DUF6069 family protein [Roseiflexaceae bacterium]